MNKIVLLFTCVVLLSACKSNKNANTVEEVPASNASATNEENIANSNHSEADQLYSILISFFSIGSGIDYERKKEMDAYLKQLENDKVDFTYDKVGWGREGEVDYCVDLSKLKEVQQKDIIKKVQEIAKKSSWIDVQLNKTCRFKNIQR